jgi:hypothetical protein
MSHHPGYRHRHKCLVWYCWLNTRDNQPKYLLKCWLWPKKCYILGFVFITDEPHLVCQEIHSMDVFRNEDGGTSGSVSFSCYGTIAALVEHLRKDIDTDGRHEEFTILRVSFLVNGFDGTGSWSFLCRKLCAQLRRKMSPLSVIWFGSCLAYHLRIGASFRLRVWGKPVTEEIAKNSASHFSMCTTQTPRTLT